MYRHNCVLCCCMLLFVATVASDSQRNFKNDDEQSTDLTVRHDLHTNSKKIQSDKNELIRYNSHENSTNNYVKQYEFRINSIKDNHNNNDSIRHFPAHTTKNDENNQMELRSKRVVGQINRNFMNTKGENNYTVVKNNNSLAINMCNTKSNIQLCCLHGQRLFGEKCVSEKNKDYSFPSVYRSNNLLQEENESLDKIFSLIENMFSKVEKGPSFLVNPNEYKILSNGCLYLLSSDTCLSSEYYCLAIVDRDIYDVMTSKLYAILPMFLFTSLIASLPFLLTTFVVYSILPELQNMHGYTLRAYVFSLFVSHAIAPIFHIRLPEMNNLCISLAYLSYFSFMASFLWLNVICFDIWWTFRKIRSSQGKQHVRKKFMLYSIYAWGLALLLDIICAIVENVLAVQKYLIQPNFCKNNVWFSNFKAKLLYLYLPIGITIISNICFFVITTLKIIHHKRHTANDLRNLESKCYNDNKQRFIIYLKLFIVMGSIFSILEIGIEFFYRDERTIISMYSIDIIHALQGFTIFVVFVCTKKIIRLLLKRLGWQDYGLLSKNLANNDYYSSTTISETVNMEDIPRTQAN